LQVGPSHFIQHGKTAIGSLLVGVILFLDAMAVCPTLHELIHHDADQAGHECAVTMFAKGKVESATVDVLLPVPTVTIETERRIEFLVFSTAIENLPQGRAPPALPAVS
jgi:hypothetical protein